MNSILTAAISGEWALPLDFGLFAAILVVAVYCLLLPLKKFSERHAKKKAEVAPYEAEIKKKYGINQIGASVVGNIEDPTE